MAEIDTRADSIEAYLTGAASDGGAQADHDLSLGGYRSSTEMSGAANGMLTWSIASPISNVSVDKVSGENGTGDGVLTASGVNDLKYTPPGGSQGDAVPIANGETKIIEGGGATGPNKYVEVTRSSVADLTGTATITFAENLNNVFGFDDVDSTELAAGDDEYRCVCLKNSHTAQVTNLKVLLATLGTQATTDTAYLAASGADTIVTGAGSFADWPSSGFAVCKDSGGTEKEVIYYSSRTAIQLNIPVEGRGMGHSSATVGTATDTVDAIPGIEIAIEAPTGSPITGIFTIAADEDTPPAAIVFATPNTAAAALAVGTLATTEIYAIWLHRMTAEGGTALANILNHVQWTYDAA